MFWFNTRSMFTGLATFGIVVGTGLALISLVDATLTAKSPPTPIAASAHDTQHKAHLSIDKEGGELRFDARETSVYANIDGEFRLTLPGIAIDLGKPSERAQKP
jgi:hypothetical protein